MTGPEHYREAERLLNEAADYEGLPSNAHIQKGQLGQGHATLALAAATALNDADGGMSGADYAAWQDTVSGGEQP
jgi:hypothetical protein